MSKAVTMVVLLVSALSGCGLTSGPVRHGNTVVRDTASGPASAVQVLPTKQYWRKAGANMEDADDAREECRLQLRSGGEYMDLLNERKPITLASMRKTITSTQKAREREINKRLSQLYDDCMASKGYEFVPRGFPVE